MELIQRSKRRRFKELGLRPQQKPCTIFFRFWYSNLFLHNIVILLTLCTLIQHISKMSSCFACSEKHYIYCGENDVPRVEKNFYQTARKIQIRYITYYAPPEFNMDEVLTYQKYHETQGKTSPQFLPFYFLFPKHSIQHP